MENKKKKLFGPIELFAFIATVGVLGFLAFKGGGGSIMERTEHVEITDNPRTVGGPKKKREYYPTDDESVEMILQQIADQYGNGSTSSWKTQKKLKEAGMTEDEVEFLEEVKEQKKTENPSKSVDWFAVLRSSHKTYSKVKSVFEKAGIDVEKAGGDVTSKLANEVAARTFYSKMEEMFDISKEDSKAFAKKGEQALSDWARFVEEKRQ